MLAMFLLLFFFLVTGGFWYLKSSIPDQLNVASYEDVDTIKLPFQSMVKDEVVYASVSAENTKIRYIENTVNFAGSIWMRKK